MLSAHQRLVQMNALLTFRMRKHRFQRRPRDLIEKMTEARQEPRSHDPSLALALPCLTVLLTLEGWGPGYGDPRAGPPTILECWSVASPRREWACPKPTPRRDQEKTNGHRCANHSLPAQVGTARAGGQPPASPYKA